MKKSVLIILVLVCMVTILIYPVAAAKPTDPPDPVCNICTKLDTLVAAIPTTGINEIKAALVVLQGDVTEILTALGLLQTDVAEIKTGLGTVQTDITVIKDDIADIKTDMAACDGGGTTGYVVYSTGELSDRYVVDLYAPGITENIDVQILNWEKDIPVFTSIPSCEGGNGLITLTSVQQSYSCAIGTLGSRPGLVQIKVPASQKEKVTFRVIDLDTNEKYFPGDFKVN